MTALMSPWKKHLKEWEHCTRCPLHKTRTNIVLARGKIPCDILFCGEAPGASEDILGKPFIGPAGKLLDYIIETAIDGQYDYALTNLIGCIPIDESGEKAGQPSMESIRACAPRLVDFIKLCKPKLIVHVGALSAKHALDLGQASTIQILHPAAILRADISTRGLAIQRCVIQLEDALEELERK